ncbi:hypothetical protein VNO80_16321 [Phaseolus coccineus]|uniref:Uncharacterized protein n=1 Tax=Phaseolus coccineus TaxID=3886 RepID=A0AAN9MLV1_PHACN
MSTGLTRPPQNHCCDDMHVCVPYSPPSSSSHVREPKKTGQNAPHSHIHTHLQHTETHTQSMAANKNNVNNEQRNILNINNDHTKPNSSFSLLSQTMLVLHYIAC